MTNPGVVFAFSRGFIYYSLNFFLFLLDFKHTLDTFSDYTKTQIVDNTTISPLIK